MNRSVRSATARTLVAAATLSLLAGAARAESATYAVEPTHTFVNFEVKHFGTSTVRGRFERTRGSVTIDPAAKTGKADITVDIASVSTGVAHLDTHLKGADFFNASGVPTAWFVGDKFDFDGSTVKSVSGNLTMAGKVMPVTLNAIGFNCYDNPMLKRQVCGGDFETTIQRSQWGIAYGLPGIPDSVHLVIQIEAIRQ